MQKALPPSYTRSQYRPGPLQPTGMQSLMVVAHLGPRTSSSVSVPPSLFSTALLYSSGDMGASILFPLISTIFTPQGNTTPSPEPSKPAARSWIWNASASSVITFPPSNTGRLALLPATRAAWERNRGCPRGAKSRVSYLAYARLKLNTRNSLTSLRHSAADWPLRRRSVATRDARAAPRSCVGSHQSVSLAVR